MEKNYLNLCDLRRYGYVHHHNTLLIMNYGSDILLCNLSVIFILLYINYKLITFLFLFRSPIFKDEKHLNTFKIVFKDFTTRKNAMLTLYSSVFQDLSFCRLWGKNIQDVRMDTHCPIPAYSDRERQAHNGMVHTLSQTSNAINKNDVTSC